MHAKLKSISSDDVDINSYTPEDPNHFFINLRLLIGLEGCESGDNFFLSLCTPGWLQRTIGNSLWGRHLLVVREFDLHHISDLISDSIEKCEGQDWTEIALKLSRLYSWEFEDYKS